MNIDWIQTASGKQFWPLAPRIEDLDIDDIAHALAMKCRYSGHSRAFYSVAEHSVHVSRHVPERFALWGLLHDASEAYLPDVPRPIKDQMSQFIAAETEIMRLVAQKFGLVWPEPPTVKCADTAILADELAQVMGPAPVDWNLPLAPLGVVIGGWDPRKGKERFLERFFHLIGSYDRHAGVL